MKYGRINDFLPDELLQEIFGHLESKSSRDACSLVCKRWLFLERISRFAISISSSTPESSLKLLSSAFVNLRCVFIDERRSMSLPVQCRLMDQINSTLADDELIEIFQRLVSIDSRDACSLVCKHWLYLEGLSRNTVQFGRSDKTDTTVRLFADRFVNAKSVCINETSNSSAIKLGKRRRSASSSTSTTSGGWSDNRTGTSCLSDSGLETVASRFAKLEKLSLIWCSNVTDLGLRSFAEKCKSLKSLDLQGCYIGDEGLAAVGACCNGLNDLNLRFCEGLTDKGLVLLTLGGGRSLKSLGVAACARITDVSLEVVGSHCKSLETLSLDSETIQDKGLLAIAKGCPLMKVLKLQCINLTDEALQAVGSYCLLLELLALYSFQRFTDRSLRAIGKGCRRLKNLTLSDCYFLSNKGLHFVAVGCPELVHLEVNGCHNIGTNGLKSIGKFCYGLSELSLLYCQNIDNDALSEIGNGCKFLQALNLVDCSGIGDFAICCIAKGCTNLRKLHIRRCYEVGNEGMIPIGQNCKFLSDLSIRFCDSIGDEALISIGQGCPSLQYLNVSGCLKIGDAGIMAIARGCPQLNYLDISVLQKLSDRALIELGEGCPLLKDIVVSHCREITNIGLGYLARRCMLLESCHLVYCPGITETGVATLITSCRRINKVLVEKSKVSERTRRRAGSIINYLCIDL